MKPDPILKELWEIKDSLAREAGYDPRRFLEQLRLWETQHPHPGPVAHNAEELRQLVAQKELQLAEASAFLLRDKPRDADS